MIGEFTGCKWCDNGYAINKEFHLGIDYHLIHEDKTAKLWEPCRKAEIKPTYPPISGIYKDGKQIL